MTVDHHPGVHGVAEHHLFNRLVSPLPDLLSLRRMQKVHVGYCWEEIS